MARAAAIGDAATRRWRLVVFVGWAVLAGWLIWSRWGGIQSFALGDTDDNLRLAQVRDWVAGQGWFDLRQYRLSAPAGFDVHWSRLVDLPIAALIVTLKPLIGGAGAERWAVALAPLLPLLATLFALGVTLRRLFAPAAIWLLPLVLMGAGNVIGMMAPLRVDHHGWQLAFLALHLAGLADPRLARGAATVAVASVLSLVVGLEMLPYLGIAGAVIALRWTLADEAAVGETGAALRGYAATLAAGSAVGFALFASAANRAPVCDALSPVWLTATIGGGALLWAITLLPVRTRHMRVAATVLAGALLVAVFAMAWPDCLGRPEGVSAELDRLWLSNVREARPIFRLDTAVALQIAALPVIGVIGAALALWSTRRTPAAGIWLGLFALAAFSTALLGWQVRAAPAAQLLAVPGAAALGWAALGWIKRLRAPVPRVAIAVAAFLLLSGGLVGTVAAWLPKDAPSARTRIINTANARCPTLAALRSIARMAPETVFTFVDLGPRLLAVTRHRAIAGPYHRNGDAILAVHHVFDGSPERARAIMKSRGATMLLVCPNMSESTIYRARSPRGFYARLAQDERFTWLEPVALPRGNPYRLWRIR